MGEPSLAVQGPTADDISRDSVWLRAGFGAVWFLTGVLVVHPLYRSVGASYLGRLGLPAWLMPVTCAFEVALAVWVVLRRPSPLLTLLQLSMVASFTLILAFSEPRLLTSPFGMLTKNLPILAAIAVAWLIENEGWSARARWLLRAGMAAVWLTEGLVPKILFQQREELWIVEHTGLAFGRPATVLAVIGAIQLASGVLALVLEGKALRWVLGAQIAGLVLLPLVVSWFVPWLWFHPFGPFTKNLAVICGTVVVYRRCSSWS